MPDEEARQTSTADPDSRAPRVRMAIGTALALGFGLLVFVAAASVLGIGLWSAQKNTVELLRDRSELSVDLLVQRLRGHLDPVMEANSTLAGLIAAGTVDHTDPVQLGNFMRGAMAATPQVTAMAFFTTDRRRIRYLRGAERVEVGPVGRDVPGFEERMEIAKSSPRPYWGELIWSRQLRATLLNRRAPVHRNGKFIGFLATAVTVADLSRHLKDADLDSHLHSFLLYDSDYVLAHPSMAAGDYPRSERQPIPHRGQLSDPVLANLWNAHVRRPGVPMSPQTSGHLLDLNGQTYAVVYRQIDGYAAVPLRAGTYVLLDGGVGAEVERMLLAAGAGGGVLLLALIAAYWLGRRIARPVRALAEAADSVRTLRLDPPPAVRRSSLAELDDAARAFNAMLSGLRWFETYVPRTLVRSLLGADSDAAMESAERDVTVLFTDIRNFTSRAESLGAAQTAAFLNRHFSLVAGCVEDEAGTIDKYIGDSVMAFWGAPHPVEDHALRACHAALAIRDAVTRMNADFRARGLPALRMGIGIHGGRVLAGNIGAPGRINYTLVGDAVNVAQRLERLCKPLAEPDEPVTVLVSGVVVKAVGDAFSFEPCGRRAIRGLGAALTVFRLRGAAAENRFPASAAQ